MVSQVVVMVADQEREDKPSPKLAQVPANIISELPNGIREQGIGAWIIGRQTQQAGPGNKGNTGISSTVKPRNNSCAVPANAYQLVLNHLNACSGRQRECQDFSSRHIPRFVWLGEFGQREPPVGQTDRRFGS